MSNDDDNSDISLSKTNCPFSCPMMMMMMIIIMMIMMMTKGI
jgi:hypothetical protein